MTKRASDADLPLAARQRTGLELLDLPRDVLFPIMTWMSPSDLMRLAGTCTMLEELAVDPYLIGRVDKCFPPTRSFYDSTPCFWSALGCTGLQMRFVRLLCKYAHARPANTMPVIINQPQWLGQTSYTPRPVIIFALDFTANGIWFPVALTMNHLWGIRPMPYVEPRFLVMDIVQYYEASKQLQSNPVCWPPLIDDVVLYYLLKKFTRQLRFSNLDDFCAHKIRKINDLVTCNVVTTYHGVANMFQLLRASKELAKRAAWTKDGEDMKPVPLMQDFLTRLNHRNYADCPLPLSVFQLLKASKRFKRDGRYRFPVLTEPYRAELSRIYATDPKGPFYTSEFVEGLFVRSEVGGTDDNIIGHYCYWDFMANLSVGFITQLARQVADK